MVLVLVWPEAMSRYAAPHLRQARMIAMLYSGITALTMSFAPSPAFATPSVSDASMKAPVALPLPTRSAMNFARSSS